MSKLFKKLNEQIEINTIKRSAESLSEEETKEIEKKVIFENFNKETLDMVSFSSKE